jgi:hypothetical protein
VKEKGGDAASLLLVPCGQFESMQIWVWLLVARGLARRLAQYAIQTAETSEPGIGAFVGRLLGHASFFLPPQNSSLPVPRPEDY